MTNALRPKSTLADHPALAAQLDRTRTSIDPADVHAGSKTRLPWLCPVADDHRWEASPAVRLTGGKHRRGTGCPACANRQVSVTNSLATIAPAVAAQWHPTRNGALTPQTCVAYRKAPAWWLGPCGHEWESGVARRVRDNTGCTKCLGRGVDRAESLAATHPELLADWHPDNDVDPWSIAPGYNKRTLWRCHLASCAHVWETSPNKRTRGSSCPACAHQVASPTYNLAVVAPQAAAAWHPRFNDATPRSIVPGSSAKAWFFCSTCASSYRAVIRSQAGGRGCPRHSVGWTREAIQGVLRDLLEHIDTLSQAQLGALAASATGDDGPDLLGALAATSFDRRALVDFCADEPSLIDTYLAGELIEAGNWSADALGSTKTLAERCAAGDLDGVIEDHIEAAASAAALAAARDDSETVEFLVASTVQDLVRLCIDSDAAADMLAAGPDSTTAGRFALAVRRRVAVIVTEARDMPLPDGYGYAKADTSIEPNLMQRVVATRIRDQRRYGNFSGTGAGKTLSAVLASRLIDAQLTVVVCPNQVVGHVGTAGAPSSGWAGEITMMFPGRCIVARKTLTPNWGQLAADQDVPVGAPRYLVLNIEQFQLAHREGALRAFAKSGAIDMLILDEAHQAKQRDEVMSDRRRRILDLVALAGEANDDLAVTAMTATPVINNLREGAALVELITGESHDELAGPATIAGCLALHAALVRTGLRWMPAYPQHVERVEHQVDLDDEGFLLLAEAAPRHGYLPIEQALVAVRAKRIAELADRGSVIYTHYVDGVLGPIVDAVSARGLRVVSCTGNGRGGLADFVAGRADVLVMSAAAATGVDGLQTRSAHLIVNSPPWTDAEWQQLLGRLLRTGQPSPVIKVDVVMSYFDLGEERHSYDAGRWARVEAKASVAAVAVDGTVPATNLFTIEAARAACLDLVERIGAEGVRINERVRLSAGVAATPSSAPRRRERSEWAKTNSRMCRLRSDRTHRWLDEERHVFDDYHSGYRALREGWELIPATAIGLELAAEAGPLTVLDAGCGADRLLEAALGGAHHVIPVDHQDCGPGTIVEDLAELSLPAASVDVVVASLSLMGSNVDEYLAQFRRVLRPDGRLFVAHPARQAKRGLDGFCEQFDHAGFDVVERLHMERFLYVTATVR